MPTVPRVPVGLSTVVGYLTGAAGVLTTVATAISGSEAQLHGPGKWTAILGVVAIVATGLGRQLQARPVVATAPLAEELPSTADELAAPPPADVEPVRPESAAVPDGAAPAPPATAAAA